jgi:fido (protein-threonine AMPylation protein)
MEVVGLINKEGELMDEAKLDLLEFISQENADIATLIKLLFVRYEEKKKENTLYSKDDYIPQNLIKIYYKTDGHLDFSEIVDNFKNRYIRNENEIEGVHNRLEMKGLEVVYDYIQSNKGENFKNIYIIVLLHQLLYSKMPHTDFGGSFRNTPTYISNSDVPTSDPESISREISELYPVFTDLIKFGDEINSSKDMGRLLEYIDKCIDLKVTLIRIHPFPDGNGRTCRALLNILFKRVNLPPTYVKKCEKKEYVNAMDKAIRENDLSSIRKFYYYKICDSIVELDINERLKRDKQEQKNIPKSK